LANSVAALLSKKGLSARLLNMITLKPLDKAIVLKAARETRAIVTLEEHGVSGGLGSAVAAVLAESKEKTPFKTFALPERYCDVIGSRSYLLKNFELTPEKISQKIIRWRTP
jgi:transketolase